MFLKQVNKVKFLKKLEREVIIVDDGSMYPDNFKKVFGREGDESYILEYIHAY